MRNSISFDVYDYIMSYCILQNRVYMRNLAKISLPMVRLVDMFVGSKNGQNYVFLYILIIVPWSIYYVFYVL